MYQYLEPIDDGFLMRPTGPWAVEKLDYLHRLISVFEKSMRKLWSFRNYIDLLAGPGKNYVRQTKQVLLGSPLIALLTEFPFTGYYFIDNDPRNTQALQERCKASPLVNNVNIMTGDCNVLVDQVVKELKLNENRSLNLAFLDPEGLELCWKTVAKLASVWKMDLVINYPQGGLNRMMANVYQSPRETQVDLFFGTQEWRRIYTKYRNQHKSGLHRELIDLYQSQLQMLGYIEVKRGEEDIRYEPLIRNTQRNAPLYRLIFASKSPLGEKFWHAVTKRDVYGQRRLLDSI
jgi:three-Cys-motif partner protein